MKKYVHPEMEIDLIEDNCEVLTMTTSGCVVPDSLSYGEGEDPWTDPWD